mmetsp:Transcript_37010/g.110597  ORF Transcript_37010/g.110597 Transcript_37010/m.110597 type:complete len:185 (-) Transcript_37010:1784-2338(-)
MFGVVAVGCTYPAHTLSLSVSRVFQNCRLCGYNGDYNIKKTPRVETLVCSSYMLRRTFALDVPPPGPVKSLRLSLSSPSCLNAQHSHLPSLSHRPSPPTGDSGADAWQVGHQGGDVVSIVALLSPPAHGRAGHQVCARHAGGLPGSVEAGDEPHNLLVAEVLPNTVARQHEEEIALAVAWHLRR